jgi:uncharacterized membrane protein YidH (DUF202 family)
VSGPVPGAHVERTVLAWQRTGLAALATGLLALRAGFGAAGIALAVVGAVGVAVVAPLRLRSLRVDRPPVAPALLLAAAAALVGAVGLVVAAPPVP